MHQSQGGGWAVCKAGEPPGGQVGAPVLGEAGWVDWVLGG